MVLAMIFILLLMSVICLIIAGKLFKMRKKYLSIIQTTHVSGIKGLPDGVKVNLFLDSERITVNHKQTIPLSRIKFAHLSTGEQLREKQKSVIKRAVAGGLVLGPLGAVVGGLSGVGTKTKQQEVLFMSLDYITKDGIEETAVFVSEGIVKRIEMTTFANEINKQLGHEVVTIQNSYEI